MGLKRYSVNLDEDTVKRFDKFARKGNMSRSQALNELMASALDERALQVRTVSRTATIDGAKARESLN